MGYVGGLTGPLHSDLCISLQVCMYVRMCLVDIAQPVPYSMEFLILLHYLSVLGHLE